MPRKLLAACLLASFVLFDFQCEGERFCFRESFSSALSVDVSPNTRSLSVGDTLWLSTAFDTQLEVPSPDTTISVADARLFLPLWLFKLNEGGTASGGLPAFKWVGEQCELSPTWRGSSEVKMELYVVSNCNADECRFRLGLIPQTPGTYCLLLETGGLTIEDFDANCEFEHWFSNNVFTASSRHREILTELGIPEPLSVNTGPLGPSTVRLAENDGAYLFEVR